MLLTWRMSWYIEKCINTTDILPEIFSEALKYEYHGYIIFSMRNLHDFIKIEVNDSLNKSMRKQSSNFLIYS